MLILSLVNLLFRHWRHF